MTKTSSKLEAALREMVVKATVAEVCRQIYGDANRRRVLDRWMKQERSLSFEMLQKVAGTFNLTFTLVEAVTTPHHRRQGHERAKKADALQGKDR